MDYLNKLREKNDDLIKKTNDDKYKLIKKILDDDDCFRKMDIDVAFDILESLGVSDVKKYYADLMNSKNIKDKKIRIVD